MLPGLYDDLPLQRREMWLLDLQGKPVFFGWCHQSALPGAPPRWEPNIPFGVFTKAG